MRSAYLSVRCVAKGVRPFHSARTPSSLTTCLPQSTMPDRQTEQHAGIGRLCQLLVQM
jgi:hypothetical protein